MVQETGSPSGLPVFGFDEKILLGESYELAECGLVVCHDFGDDEADAIWRDNRRGLMVEIG
jgi:hypothetical protein